MRSAVSTGRQRSALSIDRRDAFKIQFSANATTTIRDPSFAIRSSLLAIRSSLFAIRYSLFVIRYSVSCRNGS
ncbi:MAG: hypothetical protein D6744_01165 [Planctomycetota bacterium]|nr:MAG: hypothetical protein D6744_01165 [Planctomycetota bacterium]